MSARIGQSVGNYRLIRQLGAGGMGAVFMAEHALIGKKVALKILHRELAQDREVVTRFFNEARAVNQIGNEHIVDITDFGQSASGDHFFVMELLGGRALSAVLARDRRLAPARALKIAAQMADALAAAHAAGIVHRDLKPENVLLVDRYGDRDFVKILDFGLAKLIDGRHGALTRAGVVLGTPQYMSPEQCESKTIDARSDIYALGVLLYQMVTGAVPFDGQTMAEILIKHVGEPPAPPRGAPPAVEKIILRCLAKSPADRFASMIELREELRDAAARLPSPSVRRVAATPVRAERRPSSRRRLLSGAPLVLGLVGLVAGVASVVVTLVRSPPPEEPLAARPLAAAVADAAPQAPTVEPLVVSVGVATEPPGARIIDEKTGSVLGVTPARLDLERGRELPIVLRLPGHEDRRQTVKAGADTDLVIELEKSKRRRGRSR